MQISSDMSAAANSVLKMALQAPVEAGEGREARPDNEAAEASPAKSSLQAYQGNKIDITA